MLKLIKEAKEQEITAIAEPQEIKQEETVDIDTKAKIVAFQELINNLSQQAWSLTNNINTVISTIKTELTECDNCDSIIDILNKVNEEVTVNIGMIYSTLDMIDSKTSELIEAGSEKAEDIVAENK